MMSLGVSSSLGIFGVTILILGSVSGLSVPQISHDPNGVRFFIYTRDGDSRVEQELLLNDTNSITQSPMNATLPSTLIIHGYRRDRTRELVDHLVGAYLNSTPNANNYLVVDWGALSGFHELPDPIESAIDPAIYAVIVRRNFPIVVRRTREFIQQLVSMGLARLSDLHIVGHSLGAHISGHVGRELQDRFEGEKVARISGLDPAGPLFEGLVKLQSKINKEDADFVDVYHTAMGTRGDTSVDGHVDFYPNGGKLQPACPEDRTPSLTSPLGKGSCSHEFITRIYAATISKDIKACRCNPTKLSSSQLESCYQTCPDPVVAGENVSTSTVGQYYFRTSANP